MTLPAGMRRRIPGGSTGSTYGKVPIMPATVLGDARQGLIRVPDGLTHSLPFTEKRRKFEKHVNEQIKVWVEWLAKKGWVLNSKPKVQGPFDPASKDEKTAPLDEGMKWYFVVAHFQREYPIYLLRDADRWIQDEATRYGEPTQQSAVLNSIERKAVRSILNPERVDPLKFAAERRERLGIKADDWTQQRITDADGKFLQTV